MTEAIIFLCLLISTTLNKYMQTEWTILLVRTEVPEDRIITVSTVLNAEPGT